MTTYDIRIEKTAHRVTIALRGIWTLADIAEYEPALISAMRAMARTGPFDVLVDASEYPTPRQEIAARHQMLMLRAAEMGARRFATVTGSAIAAMQMKRLGLDHIRVFVTRAEALAWLVVDV